MFGNPPSSPVDWLVPLRLLIPVGAFGGLLFGLMLIRRITRISGAETARWRYRDPEFELRVPAEAHEPPGRRLGRIELAIAAAWPLIILAGLVIQPGSFRMLVLERSPDALGSLLGWAIYLVGLAWMIRIYQTSHVEPETSDWRYRDI